MRILESGDLALLEELYQEFTDGEKYLQPVMNYYLGGMDDLPMLLDKGVWNLEGFHLARKLFTDSHDELVKAVEEVLGSDS